VEGGAVVEHEEMVCVHVEELTQREVRVREVREQFGVQADERGQVVL
jgi:hypothetical protein